MNKFVVSLVCAGTLLLLFSSTSLAAPEITLRTGPAVQMAGTEAGFPISERLTFTAQCGWLYDQGIALGAGLRYYFMPGRWRLFASGYLLAVCSYDSSIGTRIVPVLFGTAGMEYRTPGGFRFAIEGGAGLAVFVPLPAFGISVGYQF